LRAADAVRLELKSAEAVYDGKRDKDGKRITSNLKQGDQTFPVMHQVIS
jgi:hypothetical protein